MVAVRPRATRAPAPGFPRRPVDVITSRARASAGRARAPRHVPRRGRPRADARHLRRLRGPAQV